MNYSHRVQLYRQIEDARESKVLTYITSDRQNMETQIGSDCIDLFVNLLDEIGPTNRISFILNTSGGITMAAWRLINLIRMFCEELEILIPSKAMSAGTLMAIGADKIVMTKQAVLGPIDPSINNALNPLINIGGQEKPVPVSVESVRGYLNLTRDELGIGGEDNLSRILIDLSNRIHPVVLGDIFRSREQIRFLARKLLPRQVKDEEKVKSIVDFLCADSGSHDYTIDRREAFDLGLNIEKPSVEFYGILRQVHESYSEELKLLRPFSPQEIIGNVDIGTAVPYIIPRAVVEGTVGGCYRYVSEGQMQVVQVQTQGGVLQPALQDDRTFEGWRKLE